jgi:hypothetical protein
VDAAATTMTAEATPTTLAPAAAEAWTKGRVHPNPAKALHHLALSARNGSVWSAFYLGLVSAMHGVYCMLCACC